MLLLSLNNEEFAKLTIARVVTIFSHLNQSGCLKSLKEIKREKRAEYRKREGAFCVVTERCVFVLRKAEEV